MGALDQLASTEMEIKILMHKATLTVDDHRKNEVISSKKETTPMQVQYIGPDDVNQIPLLFPQMAV